MPREVTRGAIVAAMLAAFALASPATARTYYGGGHHTSSHGGHFSGSYGGSSHRGEHYSSPTGGHSYGRHR